MAAPIGPGDWVELVGCDDGPDVHFIDDCPYLFNTPYLVESMGEFFGAVWINCAGMPKPGEVDSRWAHAPGWHADAFRPIYRPRADFIQSLKAPPINAPARVSEDA